ncbi:MAG: PAS domain-containing protein, partial [Rhodospirillales bacterium]
MSRKAWKLSPLEYTHHRQYIVLSIQATDLRVRTQSQIRQTDIGTPGKIRPEAERSGHPRRGDRVAALELLASREATEGDFYHVACRALQLAFDVRWAAAGELDATGSGVNVTCLKDRETTLAPLHYELKNSPCGVFYDGSGQASVFYDSDLQDKFPLFGIFSDIGAEGYLGQPFHGAAGKPVGHCCIMDDRKIVLTEDDLTIFHLIVQRIGAEYRRREAERSALQPVEDIAKFVNSASDWIWETDEEDRFIRMEGKVFEELNFNPAIPLGKTRKELADAGDLAAEAEKWLYHDAIIEAREPLRDFSYMRTTPGGGRQIILINGAPYYHPDGRFAGYRGMGRNITEAESVRLDTSLTRQRLDFIISGSGANLWDWNIETDDVWFSRGWIALLGLSEKEFRTFRLQDYLHPDD